MVSREEYSEGIVMTSVAVEPEGWKCKASAINIPVFVSLGAAIVAIRSSSGREVMLT